MNFNEALLQPWRPIHVTNQTLPSHLGKSNWPFPKAQLCDTNSVPRSLFLSLRLPVFSQAETGAGKGLHHLLVLLLQGRRRDNLGCPVVVNQSTRGGLSGEVEAQ